MVTAVVSVVTVAPFVVLARSDSSCQRTGPLTSSGGREGSVISSERRGPVALVVLDRPEARNALTGGMTASLAGALADADADPDVAAIVLTGRDPAFCSGLDLTDLVTTFDDVAANLRADGTSDRQRAQRGLMADTTTPVIGAVNGPAVTGGLELALGCDFLIASERATFADTHARVGVLPAGGMTIRLPQLIGVNRARQMSLTGNFVDAATAWSWGLVNEVVPHDELLPGPSSWAGPSPSRIRPSSPRSGRCTTRSPIGATAPPTRRRRAAPAGG